MAKLPFMARKQPDMDIRLCLASRLPPNNFSVTPQLPTFTTPSQSMTDQTDPLETPAVEQNGPETTEYVAPAPYIWQHWQVEILEKNLPLYRSTKSVRARTAILDKVLKKFKARITVSDNDLGDLRKVCNRSHVWCMRLRDGKQAMQKWYTVKSRIRRPKEFKIRSMNWNFRTVAAVLRKSEIKEAQGILATDGRVKFGTFQAGLNYVLEKMGEEEKGELRDIALKWNTEGPPEEEKQRSVVGLLVNNF